MKETKEDRQRRMNKRYMEEITVSRSRKDYIVWLTKELGSELKRWFGGKLDE